MLSTQTRKVGETGTILSLSVVDWIALILLIVGGLNWGMVGLFNQNVVALLFGAGTTASRLVYSLVGVAAFYSILLCVRASRRIG